MSTNNERNSHLVLLDVGKQSIYILDRHDKHLITTVTSAGFVDGVQVDTQNGLLYWTDMGKEKHGEDFPAPDGRILRSKLDGSEMTELVGGGDIVTPKQLYLDTTHQRLYWCDREGGRVMRCNVDGSGLETLVERGAGQSYPREELDRCVGIVVDEANNTLYWTQKGPPKGGQGRIFTAGIELPEGETPSTRSDITVLADHLPEPIDLELDSDNGFLYWTDRGAEPNGNSLNRARLENGKLGEVEVITRGFKETIGLALLLEQQLAYVADLSGHVYEVDLRSGDKRNWFDQAVAVTGIALY
ncbi:hypothetical protein [Carnimonas bestiolae]|uniref:hypothetical protein n=1 Tax=Carnimonas bestiolae TaxID=3402172 RepID=UPI003EDC9D26